MVWNSYYMIDRAFTDGKAVNLQMCWDHLKYDAVGIQFSRYYSVADEVRAAQPQI